MTRSKELQYFWCKDLHFFGKPWGSREGEAAGGEKEAPTGEEGGEDFSVGFGDKVEEK